MGKEEKYNKQGKRQKIEMVAAGGRKFIITAMNVDDVELGIQEE